MFSSDFADLPDYMQSFHPVRELHLIKGFDLIRGSGQAEQYPEKTAF
jgi:hypothetical protein